MIEKFNAIKKQAAEVEKSYKKLERLREKTLQCLTPKQAEKVNADMNWLCMEIDKQKHELHCLCVEAGIAKREDDRYGEVEFNPSPYHSYKHTNREPR